jgi:hypothetical protein
VFSAIAAVQNIKGGDAGMAIGALFGEWKTNKLGRVWVGGGIV